MGNNPEVSEVDKQGHIASSAERGCMEGDTYFIEQTARTYSTPVFLPEE
jgi:hypothetical protein